MNLDHIFQRGKDNWTDADKADAALARIEMIAEAQLATMVVELRSKRKSAGISQTQLSSLIGISQGDISRIESGNQIPRLDTYLLMLTAVSAV